MKKKKQVYIKYIQLVTALDFVHWKACDLSNTRNEFTLSLLYLNFTPSFPQKKLNTDIKVKNSANGDSICIRAAAKKCPNAVITVSLYFISF